MVNPNANGLLGGVIYEGNGPGRCNCDLVAKGIYGAAPRSFVYLGNGMFQPDRTGDSPVSWQALVQAARAGYELTFTGVVPGTGH